MSYSGGTPELFACNKINRKEKDRRILNTKIDQNNKVIYHILTAQLHSDIVYSSCGICYGVQTSNFLYVHVAFILSKQAPKNCVFLNLPVKVLPIKNIGVLNFTIVNGYSQNGFVGVSVTDDGMHLYCPDGLPAKYHCMDLILPIV